MTDLDEYFPHGEEGSLQLDYEDACQIMKILVNRGYAVCISGGDIGDDFKVSWVYAGSSEDSKWANYDGIIFTSMDWYEDILNYYQQEVNEYEDE